MTNLGSILKSRDITLSTKVHLVKAICFTSGYVWMWELDYKERWVPKNWCFWTVVLEKTLESPLDCKEIQPVHPKGDQPWVFIGRSDVEAETPILWPPDVKSWLIWKDSDAGKDRGQEEKGMTEVKMVGWHHRLNGHGFGWTLEVGDGQGSLVCCSSWGHKESDTTEQLNWNRFDVPTHSPHPLISPGGTIPVSGGKETEQHSLIRYLYWTDWSNISGVTVVCVMSKLLVQTPDLLLIWLMLADRLLYK